MNALRDRKNKGNLVLCIKIFTSKKKYVQTLTRCENAAHHFGQSTTCCQAGRNNLT